MYNKSDIYKLLDKTFGSCGKLLSSSKSALGIIYNGNIIIEGCGKVWYGDFRLIDESKLQEIANTINKTIYLLREHDARFENEANPKLEKAVFTLKPKGEYSNVKNMDKS